ncbi:DUF5686 and carboxypeptidase regulatory-like domain-containing protein [Psychroflexus planctonicus]|uniref:Membrane protein n=1 Tax=Psychroflexus planctonicus TaxID=1526575 RepID=A0ABQ1SCV4_9FLAO|nr:DUF5686 and carboxypeptidase regulatory-like domain-containing protein [Psychroflexus planctonicus]GGE28378.1 membrane protein [Psychroflexus planctonicus]
MKNSFFIFILILSGLHGYAQSISGKVTNTDGEALSDVNIYIEGSFTGTTSNAEGKYQLKLKQSQNNFTLVFQYLGFKTEKIEIENLNKSQQKNVALTEEVTSLDDVVVKADENPALKIIQQAIQHRKKNKNKIEAFAADFYSRSLWKAENIPEKILGMEVGDMDGTLDSTRSGIIYLSETVSKIYYQSPDRFREEITASKVSGNDNGFSWNNAEDFNVSFYNNTISFNIEMISPIADYAFNYYNYQLEGVFYDSNGFLINKVEVIPKRKKDKVFSGYIYIVEDSWEIFGVDLSTTGEATQIPPLENVQFQQEFAYNSENEIWLSLSKGFNFTWKILGMSGSGKFLGFYKNYNLEPTAEELRFTNEIVYYEKDANKRDSIFWESTRPIPLTEIEQNDYIRKDSIQTLRKSKTYLDSVDQVGNKFKILSPITGYTWDNSYKNRSFSYEGFSFRNLSYNNVQGWNLNTSFTYRQKDEDNSFKKFWDLSATANYGFSEEKLRGKLAFRKKFNNTKDTYLGVSAGSEAIQINSTNPISPLINTIAATFFERSFLKMYERNFAEVLFADEVTNGIRAYANFAFEDRNALNNSTNSRIWINNPEGFTSNHPLFPNQTGENLFQNHHIFIAKVGANLRFGQKYINRPDGKYNIPNNDYPRIDLVYEKGFGSSFSNYNFDMLRTSVQQNLNLANLGVFNYQINTGWINNNNEQISFLDFKHFNGNQTFVETSDSYLGKFLMMDYYAFSTQHSYAEMHVEHEFKGLILNRIPVLNQLNYNLVAGAKSLFTQERKPYYEVHAGLENLGFGKFRFLRLDYVQSFYGGKTQSGIMLGLQFLNFL